ncbi:MAG TPA: hypothetical protein VMA37_01335 [Acetobacteraceae bacterium]|nr:hypothetical protein [Acetobacteraceae bacterium]
MIQPISDALPVMMTRPGQPAHGTSFSQVLQGLPSLGQIAEGAADGFLAGGPIGAAVGGTLAILQSRE